MKLEEESESVRARRLSERLKLEKTVLVILDDLWEELVLSNVCIPYGDDHEGCKIIITSRSLDVCTAMECQENFEVQVLSDQDSWSLFRKKVGGVVDFPTLKNVTKDVVKECGGLPLAIVTLGGALRNNRDQFVWNDALVQMRRSSPSKIRGMHTKVYSSLKWSYNYIETEEAKLLFLFCCLFEEDYDIDTELLLIYGIGEGFFSNVDTLDEARGRLHVLVGNLTSSSLLLYGEEGRQFVKMHDLVRDVAKYRSFDAWKNWICYQLIATVWLNDIASFAEVASLPSLRVLRIYVKNVEFLSTEISCEWKNLSEFSICVAKDLPWSWLGLGRRSMRLNILSPISDWVKELLKITECLELVCCDFDDLNKFSYGLLRIGPFTNLRVLLVEKCRNSTSLLQSNLLLRLQNLIELKVHDCEELKEVFHNKGPTTEGHALLSILRELKLENQMGLTCIWSGVIPFGTLYSLENVQVINCGSLRSLLSLTLVRHIHQLDELYIEECHNMENIISVEEIELPHLRSTPIFQNLRKVDIYNCDKLKNIFSSSLACGLKKLEELFVYECKGIEEIIAEEGMGSDKAVLPQLTIVKLYCLPKLKSFYQGGVLEFPSLVCIDVWGCPKLKMFPLETGSAPNLKTIKATKEWFEGSEVEDESYKSNLESLLDYKSAISQATVGDTASSSY